MEVALIIIGALSAIASTFAAVKSVNSQKEINEQNIDFQKEVNEQNINNQWAMWNETNKYNSPQEQMLRYAEAGLNPHLIYGQSNTTNAANVGSAVAPHANPIDYSGFSSALPQLLNSLMQSDTVKRNRYQNTLTENQSDALSLANYVDDALKDDNVELGKRQLEMVTASINKVKQDIANGQTKQALDEVETLAKQLNYDWDKKISDQGLPPDLDPNTKAVVSLLAQLYEHFTKKSSIPLINKIFN